MAGELEQEAIKRVQSLFSPLEGAPAPTRTPPPVSPAPRKPARIPFDPSYPAHLKVLLSSLVRSVEPSQVGAFGEALHGCLDFLLRFCTGAAVGSLHQAGELALPVSASEAPSWAETLKLLRYAVFAWESKPTHPMRRLLRSCFFEPGEVPAPLLHTRWLGVAGYPLENGLSVEDLSRWAEMRLVEVRTEYVEVLASWLKAVRPMFVHLGRQYHVEGERVSVQLSLQGQVFPLLPPWPSRPWGLAFGAARLEEIERAQGLPGPAPPEAPPPAFVVPPETPGMPAHLRVLLARARDFATQGKVEPLARTTVHALSFLLRFSSSLLAGALSPLEEPGRALAQPSGDPLRLLHFCVFALAQQPQHPLRPTLQAVFFGGSPPSPRIHTRWLGIAGTAVQVDGLGVWEQRVAAHGPVAPDQVVPLLTLLTEWLGSLRQVFASGGLRVAAAREGAVAFEATLEGRTFPLVPPVAVGALDFQLSDEELASEGKDAFWEPERFTVSGPAVPAPAAASAPASTEASAPGPAGSEQDSNGSPAVSTEAAPGGAPAAAPEQAPQTPGQSENPPAENVAAPEQGGANAPTGVGHAAAPAVAPDVAPAEPSPAEPVVAETEQASNGFTAVNTFDSASNTEAAPGGAPPAAPEQAPQAPAEAPGQSEDPTAARAENVATPAGTEQGANAPTGVGHAAAPAVAPDVAPAEPIPAEPVVAESAPPPAGTEQGANIPTGAGQEAAGAAPDRAQTEGLQSPDQPAGTNDGASEPQPSGSHPAEPEPSEPEPPSPETRPAQVALALEVAPLRPQAWPPAVRATLEKRAIDQEAQTPPLFIIEEAVEYLSTRGAEPLVIEGATGVGKTYAARALQAWPSTEPRPLVLFEWTATHPLERLNEELNALHLGLGADVIADLNRIHAQPGARWRAFYGTLLMKNPEGLTLVLDEPRLEAVEHQPEGLQLILCQSHVGAGVRLPIHHEHAGYQKYAVSHVQQIAPFLDTPRAQALVEHCGSKLAPARLLAEGLVANLFPRTQWPQPLEPSLLMGLGSHARTLLLTLATADEMRADLLEDLGISPEAFETLVPGLLVRRAPLRLQLATPQLRKTLTELLAGPYKALCAQLTKRGMELPASPDLLYRWALHADDLELLHQLATDPETRRQRESTCAGYDAQGLPHRKIDVLDGWVALLNRLVKANRVEHCEALAWAYSSRALTWLGQGCLEPALADVEQALAWFRELVENQGQDSLINGLAAASNRRSEILKGLGQLEEAAQDATSAIRAYTIAVEKQKRADLEPLLALAYHNRSSVQRQRGQFDAAESDATRAIELYRPWVDKLSQRILLDLARTYQTRAQLALDRDEGVQARDDAQRAMDVMARIQQGDPRIDNARAARLRADAHYRMAEFATAIPDFDTALALWRPLIAEGRLDLRAELTRDLCRQAGAYARLDEQEAALTAFQEAIELSRQLVELEGRADLAELLGVALMGRAEILASFGLASEAAVDLLAALEQLGQSFERARALARLGELELELGEPLPAAGHLEQAEALLAAAEEPLTTSRESHRTSGLRERRARILALLGQAHRETGSHTASASALDRAVELFGHLVDEEGRQDLLAELARVHLGRAQALVHDNDFDTAQNDANQAVELLSYLFEGGSAELSAALASAWALKAELQGRVGAFEEALASWDQALEQYRYLQDQVELARCYHGKGRMLGAAGDSAQALETLGVALTHFEAAVDLKDEDRRRWGECLLDRSRQNLAAGMVEAGIADALAALDKTVGLDDSGALENLLASLEERAESSLRQGLGADAAAGYTQIIEISQALGDKLSGADLKTLQSRAHQRRAEARRAEGLLELACEDLTWSLTHLAQLAGLEGGDTVWLEQAQLFELRAELNRERGASERATLDLGRAIEALRRVRTPKDPALAASFERRQAGLFVDRADLCRARGDLAESWQDLTVANAALLSQVALPDPEVQRLLARATIGLAETILWMGRPLEAAEEYLRAARLLKKLAADSPEFQALHAHCLLERLPLVDVADFTPALTDAVAALPPLVQAWAERVPAEAVRQSLESEPEADRAYRLARAWTSLLEAWPDGPEGWAEMLPSILAHAARHSRDADVEMAGRVARLLLRRGEGVAAPRPWMGFCFAALARVAEGLKAGADRESLRELGRTWSDLSPHLQAMAGIMPNHLETLCAS